MRETKFKLSAIRKRLFLRLLILGKTVILLTAMKILFSLLLSVAALTAGAQSSSVYVHFAFDKYELTMPAKSTLDSLTDSLDVTDQVELHGHCDAKGSDEYNIRLSANRVKAVRQYLLSIGWEMKDIKVAEAHGEKVPIDNNETDLGRSLNRRVEIRILRGHGIRPATLSQKLADTAVKSGTNIVLPDIHFVGGHHIFLASSLPALEELLEAMKNFPALVIRVEGHICCERTTGDGPDLGTGLNNLSEARAKAVMDYLLENGISAERISYKGFGHSKPIYPYPEESEEQMTANRRVEIKILKR